MKTILNIIALSVLACPCLLVFNDVNPITGEWNWWINLFGFAYIAVFYNKVLKPLFKDYINEND